MAIWSLITFVNHQPTRFLYIYIYIYISMSPKKKKIVLKGDHFFGSKVLNILPHYVLCSLFIFHLLLPPLAIIFGVVFHHLLCGKMVVLLVFVFGSASLTKVDAIV